MVVCRTIWSGCQPASQKRSAKHDESVTFIRHYKDMRVSEGMYGTVGMRAYMRVREIYQV